MEQHMVEFVANDEFQLLDAAVRAAESQVSQSPPSHAAPISSSISHPVPPDTQPPSVAAFHTAGKSGLSHQVNAVGSGKLFGRICKPSSSPPSSSPSPPSPPQIANLHITSKQPAQPPQSDHVDNDFDELLAGLTDEQLCSQPTKPPENSHPGLQTRAPTLSTSSTSSRPPRPVPNNSAASPRANGHVSTSASAPLFNSRVPNYTATSTSSIPKNSMGIQLECFLISRDRFRIVVSRVTPELANILSGIEGNIYENKQWTFPLSQYQQLELRVTSRIAGISFIGLPRVILDTFIHNAELYDPRSQRNSHIDLSRIPSSLLTALMPFQREGVLFALSRRRGVLIGDEMGLGKTIQAIAVAVYHRDKWPLLVIVPSSVRLQWAEQFERWVPDLGFSDINVVMTSKKHTVDGRINIISYQLALTKAAEIRERRFRIIIADESHLLKNFNTKRTKMILPILHSAERVILLTGTPALSRPRELYTQLSALEPDTFPNTREAFFQYGKRYCNGFLGRFGWDFSGSSNLAELHELLKARLMIRRFKDDVLSELPPKRRTHVFLSVVAQHAVKIRKLFANLSAIQRKIHTSTNPLATAEARRQRNTLITQLYHATGTAKLPSVNEYLKDLADAGHKFLVFCHHRDMADGIAHSLTKNKIEFIRIDGETEAHRRHALVEHFQTSDTCRAAVLSLLAAGVGLTLTKATTVVIAELYWNPGVLLQAEDRAHRITQTDSVNVHYLVAKGTLDDMIWQMLEHKLEVLGQTLNGRQDEIKIDAAQDIAGAIGGRRDIEIDDYIEDILSKIENYEEWAQQSLELWRKRRGISADQLGGGDTDHAAGEGDDVIGDEDDDSTAAAAADASDSSEQKRKVHLTSMAARKALSNGRTGKKRKQPDTTTNAKDRPAKRPSPEKAAVSQPPAEAPSNAAAAPAAAVTAGTRLRKPARLESQVHIDLQADNDSDLDAPVAMATDTPLKPEGLPGYATSNEAAERPTTTEPPRDISSFKFKKSGYRRIFEDF